MSTLEIATYIGITLALLLGLVIVIGGLVWFWRRRRDEEEDTTDPDTDGDTDGDGDPTHDLDLDSDLIDATPDPTQPTRGPIAALAPEVHRGVKAMLARADGELTKKLRRETITPLLRQLRRTRLALLVVTVILAVAMAALWGTRPTNVDLYLHGSTTDEDGNLVTLDQRLHVIEAWQTENTVTSPIVHDDGVIPRQRSFTSLQDLLTQLSTDLSLVRGGYKELDDDLDSTFDLVVAMVPYLDDCYDERTSNTPDENGCWELTCTLDMRTFTRPHRWNPATSSWSPCD